MVVNTDNVLTTIVLATPTTTVLPDGVQSRLAQKSNANGDRPGDHLDSQLVICQSPARAMARCCAVSASKYSSDQSSTSTSDIFNISRVLISSAKRRSRSTGNMTGTSGSQSAGNRRSNASALS